MSPIYVFKCPRCSETFEIRRAIDFDAPNPTCGDCLIDMDKVISPILTIFKGSGWAGKK